MSVGAEQEFKVQEIAALIDAERAKLVGVLDGLDEQAWQTPSLCAGWSVRHVVSHLLMPYELSVPSFLARMLRSKFSFDRVADAWAKHDRRTNAELLEALRRTADQKFNVPGSAPEAPLSHLVLHAQDICRPLDVPADVDAGSARLVLEQLTGRRPMVPELRDGVTLVATDLGWKTGAGPQVTGPAAALLTILAGRTAALDELSGDGVGPLRARLLER